MILMAQRNPQLFSIIPLLLTLSRLLVAPLFYVFYKKYDLLSIPFFIVPFVLLLILSLSELTDFLDGYLARKYNLVSELGKILDPLVDSITKLSILFILTQGPVGVPIYWVLLILYRELIISAVRTLCALKGLTLAARMSGKIKTALLGVVVIAISLLLVPFALGMLSKAWLQFVSACAVAIASLYTIYSGVEYCVANWSVLRQFWPNKE